MKFNLFLPYIFVLSFLLSLSSGLKAQEMDYRFQTVFIYNFTKYLQWSQTGNDAEFVIGVVGESPIKQELLKMAASRKVGEKRIVIKSFANAGDIKPCHIVYLPDNASNQLVPVMTKAQAINALVVTETPGLGVKGSNINFIKDSGNWKFELNRTTTKAAGIKISAQLEKLAILVD